jgi:hypothetical protein
MGDGQEHFGHALLSMQSTLANGKWTLMQQLAAAESLFYISPADPWPWL